ncbi:hypothetical protein CBOVI_05250 [Corynebacterium bovis DSM 20582 = CIP 54.80]|uniref:Uncharacterized protein n=1 Tax=Corynebacterium bovis DSM 20582 = CIP 54.80 TaxID=927655 RepID=A0A8H9Y8B4_9CORY|nr:hypothetical protein [Corynebacterium bovis DSM 20582 = CIP 54.80]WJY77570.1 hypothetical protein CBOVI_05250 [Corynebacterium bovis DSM 20582 = CIP 54.80]
MGATVRSRSVRGVPVPVGEDDRFDAVTAAGTDTDVSLTAPAGDTRPADPRGSRKTP